MKSIWERDVDNLQSKVRVLLETNPKIPKQFQEKNVKFGYSFEINSNFSGLESQTLKKSNYVPLVAENFIAAEMEKLLELQPHSNKDNVSIDDTATADPTSGFLPRSDSSNLTVILKLIFTHLIGSVGKPISR